MGFDALRKSPAAMQIAAGADLWGAASRPATARQADDVKHRGVRSGKGMTIPSGAIASSRMTRTFFAVKGP
jgi:hypothetical protein